MTVRARPTLQVPAAVREVASSAVSALVVLWCFVSLVFLALRLLPGDPTLLILGEDATAADRLQLAHRLGFDAPLYAQYARYLFGLLAFDVGPSLAHPSRSAFACVSEALGTTAWLAGLSVLFGSFGGVGAGLLCVGPWLGKHTKSMHALVLVAASVPMLALAPLATWLLAVRLRWVALPGDPDHSVQGLLFATALLGLPLGAQVARIARATLLEQRGALYLRAAAAKGVSTARMWLRHALPVAAGPIVIVIATQLGALLGGAVVIERFFEQPGLGTLMLDAYAARDIPVLEATIATAGMLFVGVQVVATGITSLMDPRGASS